MSSKLQPPAPLRKDWVRPRIERLVAGDAENGYAVISTDGIYSKS